MYLVNVKPQIMRVIAFASMLMLFLSCEQNDVSITVPDNPPVAKSVEYSVTFSFDWNKNDFPTDYPANPHFSPLVGWVHQKGNGFFNTGKTATDGIKSMAEFGSTTTLVRELQALIDQSKGLKTYVGSGLSGGVGTISLDVTVSSEFSAVSLVTMLAPSPDWYIGCANVVLTDANGEFVATKTTRGNVYDAGTDNGATFAAANSVSSPIENIKIITQPPLGNGTEVPASICSITFTKK